MLPNVSSQRPANIVGFLDLSHVIATDMLRLFQRYLGNTGPVRRSVELAARCTFSLEELRYQYPDEIGAFGLSPHQELERLTWLKAPERYPDGFDGKVRTQLELELQLSGQTSGPVVQPTLKGRRHARTCDRRLTRNHP